MHISNKKIRVIIFNLLLFFLGVIYIVINEKTEYGIPCIFHELTGFLCPGCGITRCIISILHGNLYEAFRYNAFVFIGLPFFIFIYINNLFNLLTNKGKKIVVPEKVLIILVIVLIAFGIVRNII